MIGNGAWTSLLLLFFSPLSAASTATVLITYSIGTVDVINVSQDYINLTLNVEDGDKIYDSSTSYSLATNGIARKIYGSYFPEMIGPVLSVHLTPPKGAISSGEVRLSSQPVPLITGITNVSEKNLPITYGLSATIAEEPAIYEAIVTYTVSP